MIYEFIDKDGRPVELEFDMGKCPVLIGDSTTLADGRVVTRVMSAPRVWVETDRAHEAVGMPSIRHGVDPDVPRYSKPGPGMLGGFPFFANARERQNFIAKKNERRPEGRKILYNA